MLILLTRNEPLHMSRGRDNLGDTGNFVYCVCQLPVIVTKYSRQSTDREQRYILVHKHRDFIPFSVCSVILGFQ